MNWDTMAKQFNIVVDMPHDYKVDQYDNDIKKLCSSLSSCGYLYFVAKHDKDTNDLGESKNLHYHLVLISSKKKRCSTIAYQIAGITDYPLECIQIQSIDNLALAVQYLIHKNDIDKYQYDFNIIDTNDKDSLMSLFACDIASLKVDERLLFHLVDYGYTPLEIMFKIGLGNYTMYRKTIKDLVDAKSYPHLWNKLVLLYGEHDNAI